MHSQDHFTQRRFLIAFIRFADRRVLPGMLGFIGVIAVVAVGMVL